jgi:hypothetical protein
VLLLESSCLGQYFCGTGFSGFPTIKVCVQDLACHQEAIEKALYYLNSCYLPKRGFRATVRHLSIEEDNTGLWEEIEGDPVGFFAGGLARKRRRTRKDFRTILPIRLYNLACSLSGELRFLTFYRVLEFFFDEASDRRLSAARHDASVPDGELAKIAADRNREESCLASVLDLSAPAGSSARKRLLDYTTGHRLVGKHTAAEVAEQLYSFRNSLVHAKESETSRTRLPDPFSAENDMLRQWCYVAQTYARLAIAAFAAK